MKALLSNSVLVSIGFAAGTNQNKTNEQTQPVIKSESNMNNLVSIIEIPTFDLKRAMNFYSSILEVNIEEAEMGDVKMGILPSEAGAVNIVLANGSDYKPTTDGNILYLNGGDNLQFILDKIEPNGGKIVVPKTAISPEMGFFALFIDTEGNKLGLHSNN
jgi:predicted enzyme related to lactoylglutathione lyase